MMRLLLRSVSVLLATGAALSVVAPAVASTHDGGTKILLHVRAVTTKNVCQSGSMASCQEAVVEGSLNTLYNVFVLAAKGTMATLAAMQFGIDYPGAYAPDGGSSPISVFSWRLCATIEFVSPTPVWPSPGGGTTIIWDAYDTCQSSDVAVGGYFYMTAYATSFMRVVARPVDNLMKVGDCSAMEFTLDPEDDGGFVSFSDTGTDGCNPCDVPCFVDPVTSTTWSGIKAVTGSRP